MIHDIHHIGRFYRTVLESMQLASDTILKIYREGFSTHIKGDGTPVTQADLASSRILHEGLAKTGYPVLGEETPKAPFSERKNWNYYWCVDPLDGTKEFIKKNDEFAICIALIHENRPVFGAICSPVSKAVLFAGEDFGVFTSRLDGIYTLREVVPVASLSEKREVNLVISRSHDTIEQANSFVQGLNNTFEAVHFFSKGSALKFFDLSSGRADLYARFGLTMEWDIAAGHCILRQLGGEILSFEEKQPLTYNKEDLYNPPFVAYASTSLIPVKNA